MIALAALRKKAAEDFPGFELELDNGETVTFRSVMALNDVELKQFTDSQKKLTVLDEGEDLAALKEAMVTLLAGVSTNKKLTAECLDKECFGTLSLIFKEYGSANTGADKSEDDS